MKNKFKEGLSLSIEELLFLLVGENDVLTEYPTQTILNGGYDFWAQVTTPAKALTIAAALKLAQTPTKLQGRTITGHFSVFEEFRFLGSLDHEEIWILLLNRKNKPIRKVKIGEGDVSGVAVDAARIMRHIFMSGASSFIFVHNHPSGNPEASRQDFNTKNKFVEIGNLIDCPLLDSVIITQEGASQF